MWIGSPFNEKTINGNKLQKQHILQLKIDVKRNVFSLFLFQQIKGLI